LRLCTQCRQWCAQLVRSVGRERPFTHQRDLDPFQQAIYGTADRLQLLRQVVGNDRSGVRRRAGVDGLRKVNDR
jgi:hypothetical protein